MYIQVTKTKLYENSNILFCNSVYLALGTTKNKYFNKKTKDLGEVAEVSFNYVKLGKHGGTKKFKE